MTRIAVVAAVVLVLGSTFASEPGQPLDCSDWVVTEPGLSCRPYAPIGSGIPPHLLMTGANQAIDNQGNLLYLLFYSDGNINERGTRTNSINRVEVRRYDGQASTLLAYIENRPAAAPNRWDGIWTSGDFRWGSGWDASVKDVLTFDAVNGRLLVPLDSFCLGTDCPPDYVPQDALRGRWIAAIEGFTSLYEVQQSYSPQTNTIGFRVPRLPEGMAAADRFDTYYGPLANPIDFTQAQPLQCGYPASPPQVGDYLTVGDPLPNPPSGTGRYYVTAATYQGQTRYGRKRQGTVMSGRDPAVLPACVQPEK